MTRDHEPRSPADAQFLVAMSHQMRTPLNAIVGMTERVLESSLSAEQRAMLTRVVRASEHLLSLVEDLLEVSRIDAGNLALRYAAFDPATVLEDVADGFAERANDKGISLVVDVSAVRHHYVGDSHRFSQLAMNLTNNAVTYTPGGHVLLRLLEQDGMLRLEVSDTGPGMTEELRARAFERFVRGDGTTPGSGLGLPIVRAVAESMDGTASLEARPGGGTRAVVQLPFERGELVETVLRESPIRVGICEPLAPRAQALERLLTASGAEVVTLSTPSEEAGCDVSIVAESLVREGAPRDLYARALIILGPSPEGLARLGERLGAKATLVAPIRRADLYAALESALNPSSPLPKANTAARGTGIRVLVAEDDPDNRGVILRALQRAGHVVDVAPDGPRALQRLREQLYDLVITDVEMPGLSGIELTRALRSMEKRESVDRTPVLVLTAHALPFVRQEALDAGADAFMCKPFRWKALSECIAQLVDPRHVVMVVDDDPSSREVTARLAEHLGLRIVRVTSGEEAQEVFARRRVDLVLSDLEMPGLGGLALARYLRSQAPEIGLIAVTGHDENDVRTRCLANGFDRVVSKPMSLAGLAALVDAALPTRASSPGVPSAAPTPTLSTIQALEDMEDLLPPFLARRWAEVDELRAAADAGDWDLIRRVAHRIRGSGGAYGFMELTDLAKELGAAAQAPSPSETSAVLDRLQSFLADLRVSFSDGRVLSLHEIIGTASEQ